MYAGGRQVSQIVNGLPQASALKARLLRHNAWAESMGKDAYLSEAEFVERQRYVCVDAQKSSLSPDTTVIPLTDAVNNQRLCQVSVDATTGAVDGTVGAQPCNFAGRVGLGDTLVVEGQRFQVVSAPTATAFTVTPKPTVTIAATPDAYIVKQTNSVSDGHNKFFVLWSPPLGFFDLDSPQAAGDYRLSLNPSQDYKSSAIESVLGSDAQAILATSYDFKVSDVRLYLYTVQTSLPMEVKKMIYEQNIQSKTISDNGIPLNFTIPSSTKAITVFLQSSKSGKNPLVPPSMFKTLGGAVGKEELGLTSIQLTYANTSKPSVQWTSGYTATSNKLQQRYRDTYADAGMLSSAGGVERFEDYLTRGPIYHFDFSRTADDNSTELQITSTFANALPAGTSMFVCAWYTRVFEVASRGGTIQSVEARVA